MVLVLALAMTITRPFMQTSVLCHHPAALLLLPIIVGNDNAVTCALRRNSNVISVL